jgi:hypothetical protein
MQTDIKDKVYSKSIDVQGIICVCILIMERGVLIILKSFFG